MAYKPPLTKADLRKQLQRQINQYLSQGGKVDWVPAGKSGRDDNSPLKTVLFDAPKEPRTYVNDLVASIDQRKKPRKPEHKPRKNRPTGHYKTIYDDFGEPIRKVWVDE